MVRNAKIASVVSVEVGAALSEDCPRGSLSCAFDRNFLKILFMVLRCDETMVQVGSAASLRECRCE